jgi:hypothetical protein
MQAETVQQQAEPAGETAIIESNSGEINAGDGKNEAIFSFLTRVVCPRCGGGDTRAYCTRGQFQYRQCVTPICRHKFRVSGRLVRP